MNLRPISICPCDSRDYRDYLRVGRGNRGNRRRKWDHGGFFSRDSARHGNVQECYFVVYKNEPEVDRADFAAMLEEYGFAKYAATLQRATERVSASLADAGLGDTGWPIAVRPSAVHGLGVFRTQPCPKGAIAAPGRRGGVGVPVGWYVNHSPMPNVEGRLGAGPGDLDFVALQDLETESELLADYRQVVRVRLAMEAGVSPETLTREAIRGAVLRLWVAQRCPL